MSGQQIGTVVGGAIGAYFGGPAGAQLGMAIGGTIGGIVDPTHINGPKIGDGQQQSATDGNPIAWVQGTAMVAGTIVQVSSRRQIRHKDNGKGGPVQVTYTAVQDFAILVCESSELRDSTMQSVLMVIQDGKLVYDVRPGSGMLSDSYKWKANVDFMFGAEDQMPHPTMEAITGVGNTPAYRGSCIAVFKNFDVSTPGDRIPSFQFVVASAATTVIPTVVVTSSGGREFPTTVPVTLGAISGPVTIDYQMYDDPDKLIIYDNGRKVLDTGYRGNVTQAFLDSELAARGVGSEPLKGPGLGTASYFRESSATSITAEVWSPGTDSIWNFTIDLSAAIGTSTPGTVSLFAIIGRICKRGGLSLDDIDTSELAGITVAGYPIARQSNAADCLLPLLQAYFAYATEYDAQLHFKLYGGDAAITIDRADLIEGNDANNGAIVSNLRNQSTEFPRRIVGSYMDPAQNYTVVDVSAERRSVDVIAIGDQSFQIPVVMAADDAAKAVDKALKVAYATLEGTLEYSVPFADGDVYLSLAAGEPLQFQGKRYVLDEMMIGNGSLKLTTRYDRQSAYTSNVQPILGNAPVPPSSPYSGPTTLIPMNLPAQRPQDTVGVYIAAASTDGRDSWVGCTVQASYDGQATWQNALTITMESEIGTVAVASTASSEPITVDMVKYDLESVTSAQLAANANAFAVTDATGNVTQLGQFATATETTGLQYQLTSVSRSLGGTATAPLVVGNPFTLMDAAYFLPIDPSFAGRTLYFRGVGFGEVAEDATVYPLVYTALARADVAPLITEDGLYQFTTESGTLALSTE